jgi:hypothetical protein
MQNYLTLSWNKLTPTEFLEGAAKGMIPPADVREWTFGKYVPFMPFVEVI